MPAPVLVRSLGRVQKVAIEPPATLNCHMVAALGRWVEDTVQPAARAIFGSPVAQIIGSSYACRNIYNRENDQLSQHAFGNAFDLPSFVLANGRRIHVVLGWGPTTRDEAGLLRLVPIVANTTSPETTGSTSSTNSAAPREADKIKISATTNTGSLTPDIPKPESKSPKSRVKADSAEAKFLRRVHKEACAVFSTVLGPEANDVHRDHFHLDLQDREPYCVCH
jgi:hypothetical protein